MPEGDGSGVDDDVPVGATDGEAEPELDGVGLPDVLDVGNAVDVDDVDGVVVGSWLFRLDSAKAPRANRASAPVAAQNHQRW